MKVVGNSNVQITLIYMLTYLGLFVCVLRLIDSEVIERRHPHLLSLAKDVKLGKHTNSIGNRTTDRRVTVHERPRTR